MHFVARIEQVQSNFSTRKFVFLDWLQTCKTHISLPKCTVCGTQAPRLSQKNQDLKLITQHLKKFRNRWFANRQTSNVTLIGQRLFKYSSHLVIIHPPELDLPIVSPTDDQGHGGVEVGPVHSPG